MSGAHLKSVSSNLVGQAQGHAPGSSAKSVSLQKKRWRVIGAGKRIFASYADQYILCSMDKNMMKTLIVLLLLIPFYAFGGAINIAPENMVILQSDYPYKSSWTPTEEQVEVALMKIYEFIDNPSGVSDWQKKEIAEIKKNLLSYKVQFVGIEIEGERRIWCNFFSGKGFDYWKEKIVVVHDGGFWFWQIEYVEKTKKCINFISNGYA